mgnify:CR=1 FL=1
MGLAIVTAGTSAIGRHLVLALAQAGHEIALTHMGSEGAARALADQVSARARARYYNIDVSESCTQNGVHFLRLTKEEGEKRKPRVIAALNEALAPFARGDGIWAPSSLHSAQKDLMLIIQKYLAVDSKVT